MSGTARFELRLFGHRGACAERPENTMMSFQRALAAGANALETDIQMTADGHLVAFHDDDARRLTGVEVRVADATLAEVQRWDAGYGFVDDRGARPFAGCGITVPTLVELLEATGSMRLNIDIKQPNVAAAAPLLELLRAHDAETRVTLASFHTPVIREVRRLGFRGETVLARNEVLALLFAPGPWKQRLLGGGKAAQLPLRAGPIELGSRTFIAKCHALELRVDFWTVNDPIAAETLLDRGADGIMSDDPAALVPVFERWWSR